MDIVHDISMGILTITTSALFGTLVWVIIRIAGLKISEKSRHDPDLELTKTFLEFIKTLATDNVFIEFEVYRRTHDEGKITSAAFKNLTNTAARQTYDAIKPYYKTFESKLAIDIEYVNKYIVGITLLSGEKILQDIALGQ